MLFHLASFLFAQAAFAQTYYWHRSPGLSGDGDLNKSYNWSSDADGSGTRPRSAFDDDFSATTLGASWTWLDSVGDGQSGMSLTSNPGQIAISARGTDVWSGYNQFAGIYRAPVTGDFDVSVKVVSQVNTNQWAKAGILVFTDWKEAGKGGAFLAAVTPNRPNTGAQHGFVVHTDSSGTVGRMEYPQGGNDTAFYPCWLRVVKRGTMFTGYYRKAQADAWTIIMRSFTTQGVTSTSQIGLFVTAHNATSTSTAVFDDFEGGGDIEAAGLDLSFAGTGPNADANARLSGPLSARNADFTGYAGTLFFQAARLTLSGNLTLVNGMGLDPGTGSLALNAASGLQTLVMKSNDTLPDVVKSGAGTVQVKTNGLRARTLTLDGGSFDLDGKQSEVGGLGGAGGMLMGLQGDDTLTVAGNSDFSGLTGLPSTGAIAIKAEARTVSFAHGGKTFQNLVLWPAPSAGAAAAINVGAGTLQVLGNLSLRDPRVTGSAMGTIDFRTSNASVDVVGDIVYHPASAGDSSLSLFMGNGTWVAKGNVSLPLAAAGAGGSTLDIRGALGARQKLVVGGAALNNIVHATAGTLWLGAPLAAASFVQTGGILDFDGKDLTLTGAFEVTSGGPGSLVNLGGRTIIAGNARFAGSAGSLLGLDPALPWTIRAGTSLVAEQATLRGSNADGVRGQAGAGAVDGGGNLNWDFGTAPANPPTISREPADVAVKEGGRAVFTVRASGPGPLSYEWRREGNPAVLSTDTLLALDPVAAADHQALFTVRVVNANGSVVSRQAGLSVLPPGCDSLFQVVPDSIAIDEGQPVTLAAVARCATGYEWTVLSGPMPRILDPGVDTITFQVPRVSADAAIRLRFTATFANGPVTKDAVVTAREAIPDPIPGVPADSTWNGGAPLVLKGSILNSQALKNSPYSPAVRWQWSLSVHAADTAQAGDSLVLSNPNIDALIDVDLCMDNGGAQTCGKVRVDIRRNVVSVLGAGPHRGVAVLEGQRLVWRSAGEARIWSYSGRLLWQGRGRFGDVSLLPPSAARALRVHRARLDLAPGPR